MRKLVVWLGVLLCWGAPCTLWAGNSNSFFLGSEAAMTAGAVGAHTRGPDAVWYNPAGLGGVVRTKLDLNANAYTFRVQRVKQGMLLNLPSGSHPQDIDASEFVTLPLAIVFVRNLNPSVSYGFGVFVPRFRESYAEHSFSSQETLRPSNQTINYRQGFEILFKDKQYHIGPSIGWQIASNFRLGASLFFVSLSREFNSKHFVQAASGEQANTAGVLADNINASLSALGARLALGLQWEAVKNFHIGLLLRSPTTLFSLTAKRDTLKTSQPLGAQQNSYTSSSDGYQGGYFGFLESLQAQLSLAYKTPRFWVGLLADIQLPMQNDTLQLKRNLVWNVNAGTRFRARKGLWLGFGLFTDRTEVDDPQRLGQERIDYYGLTAGIEFRTPVALKNNKQAKTLVFLTSLSLRYALGIGKVGTNIYNPVQDFANPQLSSTNATFHEIGLQLGSSVHF